MTKTLEELLKLSQAERAEIAVTLWESLTESAGPDVLPLSLELKAELERRLEAHQRDPDSAVPWEDVLRRLQAGA